MFEELKKAAGLKKGAFAPAVGNNVIANELPTRATTPDQRVVEGTISARIRVLRSDEGGRHTPFFDGYRSSLSCDTGTSFCLIHLPKGVEMAMPGDALDLTIELLESIRLNVGQQFELQENGRTVALGSVNSLAEAEESSPFAQPEESSQSVGLGNGANLFEIVLEGFNDKIAAIKAVREITRLGLKEAKELVESAPKLVVSTPDKNIAYSARTKLQEAGATVTMREPAVISNASVNNYEVVLDSFSDNKIAAIKAVREITGLGLKEAKELVESAPSIVLKTSDENEAIRAMEAIENAGALASIR